MTRLHIICQRFPYPPRKGDMLAIKKLLDACAALNLKVFVHMPPKEYKKSKLHDTQENVEFCKLEKSLQFNSIFQGPLQQRVFSFYRVNPKYLNKGDKVYLHTIRLANSLNGTEFSPELVTICPQINLAIEYNERAENVGNFVKKMFFRHEAKLIDDWQRKNLHKYKSVHCINLEEFSKYNLTNIHNFPHGYDVSKVVKKRTKFGKSLRLVFWGNGAFSPNINAVNRIIEWLQFTRLQVTVEVYGVDWKAEYFQKSEKLTFKGPFDQLSEVGRDCDILLNLVDEGAGFQNKTVEAFSMSMPVLGFEKAFRGLPYVYNLMWTVQNISEIDSQIKNIIERLDDNYFEGPEWILNHWNEVILNGEKLHDILRDD